MSQPTISSRAIRANDGRKPQPAVPPPELETGNWQLETPSAPLPLPVLAAPTNTPRKRPE